MRQPCERRPVTEVQRVSIRDIGVLDARTGARGIHDDRRRRLLERRHPDRRQPVRSGCGCRRACKEQQRRHDHHYRRRPLYASYRYQLGETSVVPHRFTARAPRRPVTTTVVTLS